MTVVDLALLQLDGAVIVNIIGAQYTLRRPIFP
jgi:hypothetical protein